jgi:hypothetical protein
MNFFRYTAFFSTSPCNALSLLLSRKYVCKGVDFVLRRVTGRTGCSFLGDHLKAAIHYHFKTGHREAA